MLTTVDTSQEEETIDPFTVTVMAGMGEVVRRLDYERRARNTLGLRKSASTTKIQECSTFVRSSNEHHLDLLKDAMRKMEADEKQFRGVHDKRMNSVKRFHNTVHVRSTDLSEVNFNSNASVPKPNDTLFSADPPSDSMSKRRSSFPVTVTSSSSQCEAKRSHSVQPDTSRYGRSFRMLKDAFKPKTKVAPESKPKGNSKPVIDGKTADSTKRVSS